MMKLFHFLLLYFFVLSSFAQFVSDFTINTSIDMDGLYLDEDTLYVAEGWSGEKIYKITPDGNVTTFAEGLNGPIALVKRSGQFYVSEWNVSSVSVLNSDGTLETTIDVHSGPGPMTIKDDNIYVTHNINDGSGYISTIDPGNNVSLLASGGLLQDPGGIDFAGDGNLYIANFSNGNLIRIDMVDTSLTLLGTVPGTGTWKTGHLKAKGDSIYISGIMEHMIFVVDTDGDFLDILAGSEEGHVGGELMTAQFSNPNGLCFNDDKSKLYIAKAFAPANYIQVIDWEAFVTLEEDQASDFNVYPNPAVTTVFIESKQGINRVEVNSISGELLLTTAHNRMDISALPAGVYFVTIFGESSNQTQKLVITH